MIERMLCGRVVYLREGTSDQQSYRDITYAAYHVPPAWMPAPSSILDLGANIGLTTIHYQSMWPDASIEAVEMDHDNCQQAELNGVLCLEAAVVADPLDDAGYDLNAREEAYSLGSGHHKPRARYTMAGLCYPSVDFVKMDIEGEEWRILEQPDWRSMARFLLIELHAPHASEARVAAAVRLDALGFECEATTHPAGLFAWRR